jgi:hypothetical protein
MTDSGGVPGYEQYITVGRNEPQDSLFIFRVALDNLFPGNDATGSLKVC